LCAQLTCDLFAIAKFLFFNAMQMCMDATAIQHLAGKIVSH